MRAVARYSAIFLPSSTISNSATRAHFMLRTVLAASATAFSAALAKLSLEEPTISMTFWAMAASSHRTEVYRFPRAEVRIGVRSEFFSLGFGKRPDARLKWATGAEVR